MLILEKNLTMCKVCHKLRGTIEEKYNGTVPVWCKCDMKNATEPRANPCAICIGREDTDNPRIIRRPISDCKIEDGRWVHVAHYCGPGNW